MESTDKAKTVIAEDVEIMGSIKSATPIHIDGKLNGDMTCTNGVIVGQTASIKGNLAVDSVVVMGQVVGNITAKDKIDLKSTARLTGDIRSRRLAVEDGVTFVGKSEVNPSGAAQRPPVSGEARSVGHEIVPEQDTVLSSDDDKTKGGRFFGKK